MKMDISLCFNDANGNYSKFAATTIASVLENNKKEKITFHIIYKGNKENKIKIKNIIRKYDQKVIFYENFEKYSQLLEEFKNFKSNWNWGCFLILFIPLLIPKKYDKILYLDCDIIINNNLKKLFKRKMKNKKISCFVEKTNIKSRLRINFGLKNIINSGAVIFNLRKFQKNYDKELLKILKKNKKLIVYPDQDILNILFDKNILPLNKYVFSLLGIRSLNKKNTSNLYIIHYIKKIFLFKPIFRGKKFQDLYILYSKKTPFEIKPKKNLLMGILLTTYLGEFLDKLSTKLKLKNFFKKILKLIIWEKKY